MKIVLLESLGITDEKLAALTEPFLQAGHSFTAYTRTSDPEILVKQAQDADIIVIGNMPLTGEVISVVSN